MDISSISSSAYEGIEQAIESFNKSAERIAETGEIDFEDVANMTQAQVATQANMEMIQTAEDMQAVILSSL